MEPIVLAGATTRHWALLGGFSLAVIGVFVATLSGRPVRIPRPLAMGLIALGIVVLLI